METNHYSLNVDVKLTKNAVSKKSSQTILDNLVWHSLMTFMATSKSSFTTEILGKNTSSNVVKYTSHQMSRIGWCYIFLLIMDNRLMSTIKKLIFTELPLNYLYWHLQFCTGRPKSNRNHLAAVTAILAVVLTCWICIDLFLGKLNRQRSLVKWKKTFYSIDLLCCFE